MQKLLRVLGTKTFLTGLLGAATYLLGLDHIGAHDVLTAVTGVVGTAAGRGILHDITDAISAAKK